MRTEVKNLFLQFLAVLAVGAAPLYAVGRWKARHPRPGWANDYFLYLLVFLTAAFVFRFVPHVVEETLRNATAFSRTYSILANFLGLPLSFLYLLFFFRFAAGFTGSRLSTRLQRMYVGFAVLVYFLIAAMTVGTLGIRPGSLFGRPSAAVDLLLFAGLFLPPVLMAVQSRKIGDPSERRCVRLFAVLHVLSFGAYEISVLAIGTDVGFVQQLARVALNVPAALVLVLRAKRRSADFPRPEDSWMDVSSLAGRFGITGREQEVIRFVCLGKSNAEIEKELFISVKTVKRHLYSVYRKTGVKNRVQLVNLCRNSRPGAEEVRKSTKGLYGA